jgi:hypothetical protein
MRASLVELSVLTVELLFNSCAVQGFNKTIFVNNFKLQAVTVRTSWNGN